MTKATSIGVPAAMIATLYRRDEEYGERRACEDPGAREQRVEERRREVAAIMQPTTACANANAGSGRRSVAPRPTTIIAAAIAPKRNAAGTCRSSPPTPMHRARAAVIVYLLKGEDMLAHEEPTAGRRVVAELHRLVAYYVAEALRAPAR